MVYHCNLREEDFFKLYHPQRGGAYGTPFFKSNIGRQRGSGIGGIFGAIRRTLLPLFSKYVLPHARTALRNVAIDLLDSKRPVKETLKDHGVKALKGIGQDIINQSGSGRGRKRKLHPTSNKKNSPKKIKRKQSPEKYIPEDYNIFDNARY
jgi:hypothetical protein